MIRRLDFYGAIYLLLAGACLIFAGCSQPLRTLIGVGGEQKAQRKEVQHQDALFNKLLGDIRDGRLKEGTRRLQIVDKYGDPILTTYEGKEQILLYRPQVEFFNATKVYLRFDDDDVLTKITIDNEND